MLQKTPKSTISFGNIFRTGFKIVLVAEVAAFLASYAVWHRMNTNQGKSSTDFIIFHNHLVFLTKNFATACGLVHTIRTKAN